MGAPTEKVIVSVPSFALKFTLADASKNTPRSAVISPPAKLDRDEVRTKISKSNQKNNKKNKTDQCFLFFFK